MSFKNATHCIGKTSTWHGSRIGWLDASNETANTLRTTIDWPIHSTHDTAITHDTLGQPLITAQCWRTFSLFQILQNGPFRHGIVWQHHQVQGMLTKGATLEGRTPVASSKQGTARSKRKRLPKRTLMKHPQFQTINRRCYQHSVWGGKKKRTPTSRETNNGW